MSDAVTTSQNGKKVFLTCQACGAVSAEMPITPVLTGIYWCGLCGEWGFDFDIVGLTNEQMWPSQLDLVKISGPLGPDGAEGPERPINLSPRWTKP
jgi:hypothetical protein